jgi:hypothetical protein
MKYHNILMNNTKLEKIYQELCECQDEKDFVVEQLLSSARRAIHEAIEWNK